MKYSLKAHGNNYEKFYESSNEKLWNDQVALPTLYEKEQSLWEWKVQETLMRGLP